MDYANLQKGDVISVNKVERITGTKYPTMEYQLAAVALAKEIEHKTEELDNPVTTCQKQGAIFILKDSEAAEYNDKRFKCSLKSGKYRLRKQMQVNTGNLATDEKSKHLQRCRKNSLTVQAAEMAQRGELPPLTQSSNLVGAAS
jgi:hypothetical protein